MATDVISSLAGSLDAELEKAKENLKGVDDNIKKLFGKDVSEFTAFSKFGRRGPNNQDNAVEDQQFDKNNSYNTNTKVYRRRDDEFDRHEDEPSEKRRRVEGGRQPPAVIGPRMRPRYDTEDNYEPSFGGVGRRLQSRIVSSVREKSRDEVLAEQSKDKIGTARNRRMFGALLGTLHRFKQEESKLKPKEEKRAQIEAKLDEAAKKEREEVKKEKLQLIRERKLQLTEIKRLEIKRRRIAELEQWESKTMFLTNFIRTETKPHIFYLPKILNPVTECRLDQSKQYVTEMISSKRKLVLEDLEDFEQRSRRYWESRVDDDSVAKRVEADPMDEDMEYELKEIMKREGVEDFRVGRVREQDEVEDFTVTVYENKPQPPVDFGDQNKNTAVLHNDSEEEWKVDDDENKTTTVSKNDSEDEWKVEDDENKNTTALKNDSEDEDEWKVDDDDVEGLNGVKEETPAD